MPNGKHGDNPITDMLHYGEHPFPPEIEAMVLRVYELNPALIGFLGDWFWSWQDGKHIDRARRELEEILDCFPKQGIPYLEKIAQRQWNPVIRSNMRFQIKAMRNLDAKVVEADGCIAGFFRVLDYLTGKR